MPDQASSSSASASGGVVGPSVPSVPSAPLSAPSFASEIPSFAPPPDQLLHEPLATELRPVSSATLTIRVIKSFPYRTQKSLVLKDVDLSKTTVGEVMERVKEALKTAPGFKPYRALKLDTLKKYTVAHGHKTINLIINLDHDEWILDDLSKTLVDVGCENETELSFFNRAEYEEFKLNPEVKWD